MAREKQNDGCQCRVCQLEARIRELEIERAQLESRVLELETFKRIYEYAQKTSEYE